jgi:repressor LexA
MMRELRRCACGGEGPIVAGCDGWHNVPGDPLLHARRRDATAKQSVAYALIVDSVKGRGYPPTLRELASMMGVRSTNNVHYVIQRLRAKGLLSEETSQGKARSLVPT